MAFPLMTGFLFSALTLPWNLLGHVDLVVEVNEGVTDGSNVHSSARIEGSSGAQVPSLAKSVPSRLLHVCQGRGWHCSCLHRKDRRAALSVRSVYHELLWAIFKLDLLGTFFFHGALLVTVA